MSCMETEPETRPIENSNCPVIHADQAAFMEVLGDRLWVTFVEQQPIQGRMALVTTGYLSFKLQGVPPAIGMAVDKIANAGMSRIFAKPKFLS